MTSTLQPGQKQLSSRQNTGTGNQAMQPDGVTGPHTNQVGLHDGKSPNDNGDPCASSDNAEPSSGNDQTQSPRSFRQAFAKKLAINRRTTKTNPDPNAKLTSDITPGSEPELADLKKASADSEGEQCHLKEELANLKTDMDNLKQGFVDLRGEFESTVTKLKKRNEKLQTAIDDEESVLGFQHTDEAISAHFKSLIYNIKHWANGWCDSTVQDGLASLNWQINPGADIIESILPRARDNKDIEEFLAGSVRRRRRFVSGWIGFHITRDVFKTTKSPQQEMSGSDIWLPNKLSISVEEVELALIPSETILTMSEFHQWRSLTMNMLSKKYSTDSKEAESVMQESARRAIEFIAPMGTKTERELAIQKLVENVYKPALVLAQLLRRQRALWSVWYPHRTKDPANESLFDPAYMSDCEFDEDEAEPNKAMKVVSIVSTPTLYKTGTMDGTQYDEENVMVRAEVTCTFLKQK